MRIVATVAAVLLFWQPVFAGQFLSGVYPALHAHRENATIAGITMLVCALVAGLLRWRGGGPWWPIFAYLGMFAMVAAQIMLGFAHVLAIHIPLGVTIVALGVALCIWTWRGCPLAANESGLG